MPSSIPHPADDDDARVGARSARSAPSGQPGRAIRSAGSTEPTPGEPLQRTPPRLLLAAGGLLASVLGLLLADPVRQHPVAWLLCFAGAFASYLLALRMVLTRRDPMRLAPILVVAFAARALLLPASPGDDVHRYLWEGRVIVAGFNPWRLAPDDPALAGLAAGDPDQPLVNHRDWPAIYPPGVAAVHAALVLLGGGALALKIALVACEALLVLLLLSWLRARTLPPARVLIYAWNPLALVVTAGQAHHDVLAATALVGALLLLERGASRWAPSLLALAVLLKGFALVAAPAFLLRPGSRRPRAWLAALTLLGLGCIPVLLAGGGLGDSLLRFGREMHFNDSGHALLAMLLGPSQASLGSFAILALTCAIVLRRGVADPARSATVLVLTLLLLLPTVHPWYLIVLLPLLCVFPWWGPIAWSGTVALPWLAWTGIADGGHWVQWPGLRLPEYAPLALWLLLLIPRTRRPGAASA